MRQSTVVDLDAGLALRLRLKLPMADSIIPATAQAADAAVWTQDVDFEGLAGVEFWHKA